MANQKRSEAEQPRLMGGVLRRSDGTEYRVTGFSDTDGPLIDMVPRGKRDTSAAAFDGQQASGKRQSDQMRILAAIGSVGAATCDELEVALRLPHQTCSARINDLWRAGLIARQSTRRPTRAGGMAACYGLTLDGHQQLREGWLREG